MFHVWQFDEGTRKTLVGATGFWQEQDELMNSDVIQIITYKDGLELSLKVSDLDLPLFVFRKNNKD